MASYAPWEEGFEGFDRGLHSDPTYGVGAGEQYLPEAPPIEEPSYGGAQQGAYQGLGNWSDPFGYTGGSLLTPWTQALPDIPAARAGAGSVQFAPFQYGDIDYGFARAPQVNVGQFSDPTGPLSYGRYQEGSPYNYSAFNYDPTIPDVEGAIGGVRPTFTPDRYAAATPFQAPRLDETNDPGYEFRRQEAMRALKAEASAQGVRGGDVLKRFNDYAQNYASSEYDKVYGRSFDAYNAREQQRLQAFGADTEAQRVAQAQAWEQAMGRYQAQLAAQNQGYAQASNTAGMNQAGEFNEAQFNEAQRQGAYGLNRDTYFGVNDRNYQNALNAYTANTNATLGAAGINSQNTNAANQLGWEVAAGKWDRNYAKAYQSYQDQYNQANAAAGASAGAANQDYGRQMQQYGLAYDMFRNNQSDQFGRLVTMAGIGQNAAALNAGAIQNMGNQYSNLVTGQGNANAASQVARGSSWGDLFPQIGNSVATSLIARGMSQQGPQPQGNATIRDLGVPSNPWDPNL